MIPVSEPVFSGNEKTYLLDCISSGWISSEGPFVKKFEDAFSAYLGVQHGTAVSSGTAALETALYSLGVGKGDEVIIPSFTIISCAIVCIRLGAVPVLVDIDPDTWTMDVSQVESRITSRTKVVMPVHMFGHPVEMDTLFRLQNENGFYIMEDFAQAQGAEYFSQKNGNTWLKCGAMGDVGATSFYANKIITTGEGGMVVTDGKAFFDHATSYRNLCFIPQDRFRHEHLGYNFRLTNIQAAIGLAQCEQIESVIRRKRELAKIYQEEFCSIQGVRFMEVKSWAKSVYWMFSVELAPEEGVSAKEAMAYLKTHGIGTRPFFLGMHRQPALKKLGLFANEFFPKTDFAYKYGFYLPSGLTLKEHQIKMIVRRIKDYLESKK